MGILRTDRVSGLGGANAIKGSTKLSSNRLLEVHGAESNEDFRLSNGSFTIEFWAYIADTSNSTFVALFENNPARRSWQFEARSNQALRFEWWTDGSSGTSLTSQVNSFIRERWHHFAAVRNGTALNIYVDGTSVANTTTSDTLYENTIEPLSIGGIFQSGALTQPITGFISNLRIIKGEAIYTANFTPPTSELTVTSNTVVLACQSPGNILQEATGKTIVATTSATNNISDSNNTPPEASHFTPNSPVGFSTTSDVGSQYGSNFDGFGSFATSTYMIPSGGNTRERNRGRGIISGGGDPSGYLNSIEYISIQSMGNSFDFGDLSSANKGAGSTLANETRAVCGGGLGSPINIGSMDFFTIATQSNTTAANFGDLVNQIRNLTSLANSTRGIFAGGTYSPGSPGTHFNTIQFITIATAGDATSFGEMQSGRRDQAALSSSTRGIIAGGNPGSGPQVSDEIDYITIASAGNAQDFGDLTNAEREIGGAASSTRGIIFGGYSSPAFRNTIDFITIATTGSTDDFGDLTVARTGTDGCSNKTRAAMCGGSSPTYQNLIDFVTLTTTGNAADFGDLIVSRTIYGGCTSDSHGGLE